MKTEEIQARFNRGYTMTIYGTREKIHEQMTNDIKTLLEAINYIPCCKSDSELLPDANRHKCNCSNSKDRLDCGFECYNK